MHHIGDFQLWVSIMIIRRITGHKCLGVHGNKQALPVGFIAARQVQVTKHVVKAESGQACSDSKANAQRSCGAAGEQQVVQGVADQTGNSKCSNNLFFLCSNKVLITRSKMIELNYNNKHTQHTDWHAT